MEHRKRVRHYEETIAVHELTFSCYLRTPLLVKEGWRALLAQSITRATERHRFRLLAFVFMPEHVHLLVLPSELECSVSGLLRAIKRPYSYRIKQLLQSQNSQLLSKLTIRQRPKVTTFRYWQEGPGYDRNLFSPAAIQSSIDYIHANPVRRRLCKQATDWKWSSARHYLCNEQAVDVDLPKIDPFDPQLLD